MFFKRKINSLSINIKFTVDDEYGITEPPTFDSFIETQNNPNRSINVQELIDAYIEKNKSLKEFEEEMKKHKDKLTPGQIGES